MDMIPMNKRENFPYSAGSDRNASLNVQNQVDGERKIVVQQRKKVDNYKSPPAHCNHDNPMTAKKLIFKNGKPLGADRTDNLALWDAYAANLKINTYEALYNLYSYSILRQVFTWAREFRAGTVIIYREPRPMGAREILLVRQKEADCLIGGELRRLHERRGPPKGSSDFVDKSALATAIRETYEETGINILDPTSGAKLMPSAFLSRRPEFNIEEIIIYFVVVFEKKPEVKVCKQELNGYTWVDMSKGLRDIQDVTSPTKRLLESLENTNLYRIKYITSLSMPDSAG